MTKAEKDSLNQLVAEMADNISKSKHNLINIVNIDQKSIQLLAKEVAVTQATMQAYKDNTDEMSGDTKVSSTTIGKQIAELYA